jgi:hypothetical protein
MSDSKTSILDNPREVRAYALNLAIALNRGRLESWKNDASAAESSQVLLDARAFESYINGDSGDVP